MKLRDGDKPSQVPVRDVQEFPFGDAAIRAFKETGGRWWFAVPDVCRVLKVDAQKSEYLRHSKHLIAYQFTGPSNGVGIEFIKTTDVLELAAMAANHQSLHRCGSGSGDEHLNLQFLEWFCKNFTSYTSVAGMLRAMVVYGARRNAELVRRSFKLHGDLASLLERQVSEERLRRAVDPEFAVTNDPEAAKRELLEAWRAEADAAMELSRAEKHAAEISFLVLDFELSKKMREGDSKVDSSRERSDQPPRRSRSSAPSRRRAG